MKEKIERSWMGMFVWLLFPVFLAAEPELPKDPSGMWYRAFLTYESCLELEKKGKYLEALNRCNEAKAFYDGLRYQFPEFQPEIVKFKQKIVSDTRLRIKTMIGEPGPIFCGSDIFRQKSPPRVNAPEPVVAKGLTGGALLWICIIVVSAMIVGFFIGLWKRRARNERLFDNKFLAISMFLLFASTLIFGLASLYFRGFFDIPASTKIQVAGGGRQSVDSTMRAVAGPKSVPPPQPIEAKPYNPKPVYRAPGPEDPPLFNTHDLVDTYLRAPSWKARIPYTYRGRELESEIEKYYQKWPDPDIASFKMKLFQLETEEEYGGPFWVYQVILPDSEDTQAGGVPLIIRSEGGNLKVDWEVYSEFSDEHFVKFVEGGIAAPRNFRLVAERVASYDGPDASAFKDLDDYLCYEINPPYGGYRAYSEYAFVKKGTNIAKVMSDKIAVGDDPLAVIVTLDKKEFGHGINHYIITEFVDEGWFR